MCLQVLLLTGTIEHLSIHELANSQKQLAWVLQTAFITEEPAGKAPESGACSNHELLANKHQLQPLALVVAYTSNCLEIWRLAPATTGSCQQQQADLGVQYALERAMVVECSERCLLYSLQLLVRPAAPPTTKEAAKANNANSRAVEIWVAAGQ